MAPNGRSLTSYIDVRDVAGVAVRTLKGGFDGQAIALTGPVELSLDDVASAFAFGLGYEVRNRRPSLPRFFRQARQSGAPISLADVMTSIGLIARLVMPRVSTRGSMRYWGAHRPALLRS